MEYKNEASHKSAFYREKHFTAGLCCDCGSNPFISGKKRCADCLRKASEGSKKYRAKNRDKVKKRDLDYYYKNHEQVRISAAERAKRLRAEIFKKYGGAICACCGVVEEWALSLDHINNDGAAHRRELFGPGRSNGRSGYKMYLAIRKAGFPPGFQVLCMNCQVGKVRNGGICPHKMTTLTAATELNAVDPNGPVLFVDRENPAALRLEAAIRSL